MRPPHDQILLPVFLHGIIREAELLEVALQVRKLLLEHLGDEVRLEGLVKETHNANHVHDKVLHVVLRLDILETHASRDGSPVLICSARCFSELVGRHN